MTNFSNGSILGLVITCLTIALFGATSSGAEESIVLEGVDVSHHQGEIDWLAVAASGKSFAFAKATEGIDFTDPAFADYWQGMGEAGLLRGAYHFYIPADDGGEQAEFFLATVPIDELDLPPVLDVEVRGVISKEELLAGILAWLEAVEAATGTTPIVYTDRNFWNALDASGQCSRFPLWIADYGVQTPVLPNDWDNWTLWQHTQEGQVDGLEKPVDLSRFRGAPDDLRSLGLPTAVKAETQIEPETATSAAESRDLEGSHR